MPASHSLPGSMKWPWVVPVAPVAPGLPGRRRDIRPGGRAASRNRGGSRARRLGPKAATDSQTYSKVGIGGELRAGSAGIEGILPSFEGGMPSIPGYSHRTRGQDGETRTPNGDF